MRPRSIIIALVVALCAIEGLAYWWMHPAPAGAGQPVLVYRPGGAKSEVRGQGSEVRDQTKQGQSTFSSSDNRQPTTDTSPPRTYTPLPEIYDKAAPMLRCSTGQVYHVDLDEAIGLHLAFFEWDGTDTGSVLEAFRHMPESCMGSLGMILVSKEKPLTYQIEGGSLIFAHTIFRDRGQGRNGLTSAPPVHAYRAIWVSGMDAADERVGLHGDEFDRLRIIRVKSALTRYRPAHARVIQGAVRGAATADAAWQAFEQTMLKDLKFEKL